MPHVLLRAAAAVLAGSVVALAGCGSERDTAATGAGSGDVAAANDAVAQFTGEPTAFPVDTPLKSKPEGKTFAYLPCPTPACARFAQMLEPTQDLLGYQLKVVKAGPSANELQAAMDSILSLKPDGVLLPASNPNQHLQQMQELEDAGIPVSANGIVHPEKYGLEADFINNDTNELAGKLMADWAVAQGGGEVAFLTKEDITFDPTSGWVAYPDSTNTFAKLWGAS
jgi:ABC-type sugar transport system substrate-binding protein